MAIALPIAVLVALAGAVPAVATLTASLQDLAMPTVPYSHYAQSTSGRAVLTVTDSSVSGLGMGWNVTEQTSALVYSGPNHGVDIPAAALAVVSVEAPVDQVGSQPIDPTNGPLVPSTTPAGSLDAPRMVLHANPGYGAGTYTLD